MTLSNLQLNTLVKAFAVALVSGYVISLLGILALAWVHDGSLATQAMNVFAQVITSSGIAAGAWGALHTVASNLRMALRSPAAAQDAEQPSA